MVGEQQLGELTGGRPDARAEQEAGEQRPRLAIPRRWRRAAVVEDQRRTEQPDGRHHGVALTYSDQGYEPRELEVTSRLECGHMDVGVRELKARLSELVDAAERGELVRITDRGRPKALLGPLPDRARLEEGIADGWIRPGSGQALPPVRRHRSSRTVGEVLDQDRG